ncbi:MAG: dipeptidase [Candidatus Sumerlaeota bacterium]|nr:dipeptidase [Candidatus Sumerlaeota bacterium]
MNTTTGQNPLRIFDGHNDSLGRFYRAQGALKPKAFFAKDSEYHLDFPRAVRGGFGGGLFAVHIPNQPKTKGLVTFASKGVITRKGFDLPLPPPLEFSYAQSVAMRGVAALYRIEAESRGRLRVVRSFAELQSCWRKRIMAAVLHFEGADAIDADLTALEVFYQAGLRSLGITWSRPNAFGCGVPMKFPGDPDSGPGLTSAGKRLVRACNHLGIMIDLSHLNERGFWDVARLSKAPLVATHSAAHALTPTARNLKDKQLDAIRESDGVVGVTFHVGDIGLDGKFDKTTPLEYLLRHIDYLVGRMGIERVALGSDFDGCRIPNEIGGAQGLPKIIAALRKRGYGARELKAMAHGNWMRILRKTWGRGEGEKGPKYSYSELRLHKFMANSHAGRVDSCG